MREVICSAITIFFMLSGLRIEATQELDSSSEVLKIFYQLFKDSSFGYDPTEEAGWILSINGEYFLQKWPRIDEKFMQIWNGPLPRGVIAVAHTHATGDIQKPSKADINLAKRLHLPVYMICIGGIWKVDEEGIIANIKPPYWFKEMKAKARKERTSHRKVESVQE